MEETTFQSATGADPGGLARMAAARLLRVAWKYKHEASAALCPLPQKHFSLTLRRQDAKIWVWKFFASNRLYRLRGSTAWKCLLLSWKRQSALERTAFFRMPLLVMKKSERLKGVEFSILIAHGPPVLGPD